MRNLESNDIQISSIVFSDIQVCQSTPILLLHLILSFIFVHLLEQRHAVD